VALIVLSHLKPKLNVSSQCGVWAVLVEKLTVAQTV
jgi:hypothetical protein